MDQRFELRGRSPRSNFLAADPVFRCCGVREHAVGPAGSCWARPRDADASYGHPQGRVRRRCGKARYSRSLCLRGWPRMAGIGRSSLVVRPSASEPLLLQTETPASLKGAQLHAGRPGQRAGPCQPHVEHRRPETPDRFRDSDHQRRFSPIPRPRRFTRRGLLSHPCCRTTILSASLDLASLFPGMSLYTTWNESQKK